MSVTVVASRYGWALQAWSASWVGQRCIHSWYYCKDNDILSAMRQCAVHAECPMASFLDDLYSAWVFPPGYWWCASNISMRYQVAPAFSIHALYKILYYLWVTARATWYSCNTIGLIRPVGLYYITIGNSQPSCSGGEYYILWFISVGLSVSASYKVS